MSESTASELGGYYGDEWYKIHASESFTAGRMILGHLWQYWQPNSVVDAGCGRGTWLAACHQLGAKELVGLDGEWNNQAAMLDQSIHFRAVDLNRGFAVQAPLDLAMSVEVGEHLEPASSELFVESLTRASTVVVFGSAYTEQGGTNHINERRHSWWAGQFLKRGYVAFDLFRPKFWSDERIPFWYRQNTFLYVKHGSAAYVKLCAAGIQAMPDVAFADCIHPALFEAKAGVTISFRNVLKEFVPSMARSIRRRMRRS